LVYKSFLKKHHPKQALWIQENFNFTISKKLRDWIEVNINIYQKKYGIEKFAFVVSRDLLVHLAVLNSFEEINSVIKPKHFINKTDAIKWLDGAKVNNNIQDFLNWQVHFDKVDLNGNVYLKIKQSGHNILETFNIIKSLISKQKYFEQHIDTYISLTKREKQVLLLYGKGNSIIEISQKLNISINTTRTHWKNIKRKLDIKSFNEVTRFINAYNLK